MIAMVSCLRRATLVYAALLIALSLLLTRPADAQSFFVSAANRIDAVHDHKRDTIYISNGNQVLRWHVPTQQFLPPFQFRTDSILYGMDISPDDETLVVADARYQAPWLWVWSVDLDTGAVRQRLIQQDFYEGGSFTVAYAGDGTVLISTNFQGSGWTPLRRWDPATDTMTVIASIRQSSMLRSSADASVIGFAESNISDGRLGRYRVADRHVLNKSGYSEGTSWFNFEIAANRNGTQYGLPTYGGTFLYDGNLVKSPNTIGVYASGQPIGIAYHPTQDLVYFPWAGTSEIRVYNSQTRLQVGAYPLQNVFDHTGNRAFGEGRVRLSRDGSLLLCTVAGGVRYLRIAPRQSAAHPQVVRTLEDAPVPITLSGTSASTTISYEVTAQPANGTLTGTAPHLEYTPKPNFAGIDTFQFRVGDGTNWSAPTTVTVGVMGINDAPSFQKGADQVAALNSGAKSVAGWATQMSAGPADEAGQSLTFLTTNDNPALFSAQPAVSASGTLTFTPVGDQSGTATVTVQLKDNGGTANGGVDMSPPQTFTITVTTDRIPTPANDTATGAEDTLIRVNVLANDTDPDGDPLTLLSVTRGSKGSTKIVDGQVEYTPQANFHGTDSFTYTVGDGREGTATATVTVQVTPVNDPPAAINGQASVNEDSRLLVRLSARDLDGDSLSYTIVTQPAHGTLSGTAPADLFYTPQAEYSGPDSFTFKVNDGKADSNIATFSITVLAVNDAPVAAPDAYESDEDAVLNVPAPGVLANDRDVDGTFLAAGLVSSPQNGTLSLRGDGSFTYTPKPNFHGTDRFTYLARDSGQRASNSVTVTLTVRPVPDAPIARNDSFDTSEDASLTLSAPGVLSNDVDYDGDSLSTVLVTGPSHGTLTLEANGSLRYVPNPNFQGTDTFTYRAAAGGAVSDPATVQIVVAPVNDPPVAAPDQGTTPEDTAVTLPVLGNDADPENDPLILSAVTQGANGSVQIQGGQVVYTPAPNSHGTDTFTYTVSDGKATASASVTVTVMPVNDAPTAAAMSVATDEDTPTAVTLSGGDVDGDTLTFEVVDGPTKGGLTGTAPNLTYTPGPNFHGTDAFTFRVRDGQAESAPSTVTLTVNPVNDAPVAQADAASTPEDTYREIPVLANDTDVDGDSLAIDSVTQPAHGTVEAVGGNVRYTPALNYHGPDSFTYTVRDGKGGAATATVTLTVTPVNDAPVARPDTATTTKNSAVTFAVLVNDTDADGDALRVASVTQPARGNVVVNTDGSVRYTPKKAFTGTDTFTYTASDGKGGTSQATVTVTVRK